MDGERSKTFNAEQLAEWSDEQLRQLLLTQMDAAKVDVDLVRRITAILAVREEEHGHEIDPRVALETFKQEYDLTPALFSDATETIDKHSDDIVSHSHVRMRKLLRLLAIAAVIATLLIGITVVANASGLDLWGVVTKWTSEVFEITNDMPGIQTIHKEQTDMFYHLKKKLEEMGVSQPVVPNYIPDGYSLIATEYTSSFEGNFVYCSLSDGENELYLHYWLTDENQVTHFYAIDDSKPNIYECNGIKHYIMTNENEFIVSWTNENLLCDISGVQNYDEIIRMINSIYEKEK